jgi:S-adenosylmethionine/arginine decarboxylase-like enzyme
VRFLSQAASHAPTGRHITLDFYQVPQALAVALEDTASLHRKVSRLITQAGMTLLGHSCHVFEVQGITCAWLLSESHLSLHTWPEHGYAGVCGDGLGGSVDIPSMGLELNELGWCGGQLLSRSGVLLVRRPEGAQPATHKCCDTSLAPLTPPHHTHTALDIFTCGTKARPELLAEGMKALMQPGLVVREEQKRGGLELADLTPEQRKAKVRMMGEGAHYSAGPEARLLALQLLASVPDRQPGDLG